MLLDHESALDLECHDTLDRLVDVPKHNEWLLLLKSVVPRGIVSRAKSLLIKGKSRQTKNIARNSRLSAV